MFHLFMATPEKVFFEGSVQSVKVPGGDGYFEVLTGHASIISTIKTGVLEVKDADGKRWVWAVTGGYFEMSNNEATLLADTSELDVEIDLHRAEASLKKALKRIDHDGSEIDMPRAKKSREHALNRIKVAKASKKR